MYVIIFDNIISIMLYAVKVYSKMYIFFCNQKYPIKGATKKESSIQLVTWSQHQEVNLHVK